jgi:hypothetical protein
MVKEYVSRGDVQLASSPPASALVVNAALSTMRNRPIHRWYNSLDPVSSITVS